MKTLLTLLLAALICVSFAPLASADTVDLTIGIGNVALSGFAPPYANVDINRTSSTTAIITFTSDTVGGNIYLFGDSSAADVNVNATTWTITNFSASNAGTGFSPGPISDGGSGTVDGLGVFNQTTTSFDGFTSSSDTISFLLTNTSGTWADAASVLTPNAEGFEAAAHIFVTTSPANATNGALVTGFAANGVVPEPKQIGLLIGFVGLMAIVVRFRKRTAPN